MADRTLYTSEASRITTQNIQTALALSFIRLFDETLIPTPTTTQAELAAAETTLVGYPAGGYPVTAFHDPINADAGGDIILSPLVQPEYASGAPVTIGGYWLEDAGGKVRQVFIFQPQRPLASLGQGFPIVCQLGYGGPTQV